MLGIYSFDKEIRKQQEKGISLAERKKQAIAIEILFRKYTSNERARKLAVLCYTKTLGTPFTPFDLAEIALVETGGHKLSAGAVSEKGALGVWQLMPERAKSHGYTKSDMIDDEKCATAAIRELYVKLQMAQGNMEKAKKLYCGQGPQAEEYIRRIKKAREELLEETEQPIVIGKAN